VGDSLRTDEGGRLSGSKALPAQIADDLQRRILSGDLQPADRLPSERQLVAAYSVSRTAVREAVKLLSERGLVYSQAGRGTFIADVDSTPFTTSMSLAVLRSKAELADVLVVRRLLEMETVALAAVHRTESDLRDLEAAIEAMDRSLDSMDGFIAADHQFHRALAAASGNPILVLLVDSLAEPLQATRRVMYWVEGAPVRGQRQHRAILDAVRKNAVGAARDAMAAHLEEVAKATARVAARKRLASTPRRRRRAAS
jgi:GntR family transcriptional repressor for pyruvate dehydrogenase complex